MQKLIKITETHYIIVDDSEIKEGDWVYSMDGIHQWFGQVLKTEHLPKKIAHSTQPLEYEYGSQKRGFNMGAMGSDVKLVYDQIKPISLSDVEELVYGYSVDEMAYYYLNKRYEYVWDEGNVDTYKAGFNAHKELVKDKFILSKEQIEILIEHAREHNSHIELDKSKQCLIQSLLPPTEWDVKFDEHGKLKLV